MKRKVNSKDSTICTSSLIDNLQLPDYIKKKDRKIIVDAVFSAISDEVLAGHRVVITGLGAFDARIVEARVCPFTKEYVEGHRKPVFEYSQSFKKKMKSE